MMNITRAEELMAAYLSGNIAAAEQEELLAWVAASPDGKKFFDNAVTLWGLTEQMAYPDFGIGKQQAWTAIESRLTDDVPAARTVPTAKVRSIGSRTRWAAAAAVALLLTAGWWWMQPAPPTTTFADTTLEEQRELTLPDGTQVWLNENTTLSYVNENNERRVELSGEAFFDVATDSILPFRIYTDQAVTTVLGTSFNIRAYPEEEEVEVSVKEGKVALAAQSTNTDDAPGAERIELLPGDQGVFEKATTTIAKKKAQAKNSTAWKDGVLDFDSVPIGEIIVILERYYDIDIELSDTEMENCKLTAMFENTPLPELLQVIEFSTDWQLEEDNGIYRFSGEGCN